MDAGRLGFAPDTVIQELGWDEDVDDELRKAIESQCGSELVDGDVSDAVDGVILWWRDGDGDLVDALLDSLQDLAEGGSVWLITPKVGRPGYVPGADIVEAAPIAGLSTTTTSSASPEWSATKLSTHKR
ncbi:DUF3052 domain-containing protein [Aeromicrobium sp.]|uniref:DUF3052 domain-containing protein n=1 Tax=Aeromicrobium sp. TaxID=1871063 RepID=UPI003D6AB55F